MIFNQKIKTLSLLFIIALLFSCESKKVTDSNLAFDIKEYHYSQEDSLTAYVIADVNYFQIDSKNELAQEINSIVLSEYKEAKEEIPADPNQLLSLYFYMQVEELKEMIAEIGETAALPYEVNYDANVALNNDSLFTFEMRYYSYTGGAHGNRNITFSNYSLKTNQLIRLTDLFSEQEILVLNKMGEKSFRESLNIEETKSLGELGYSFVGGFKLPNNFLLQSDSIQFYYAPYEIGPYSLGDAEFSISYKAIKQVLTETNLFKYVN